MSENFSRSEGRYTSLATSRFKEFTYGTKSDGSNGGLESHQQHGTYGALLFDKRWIARRHEILIRDNYECVICKDTEALQVHHRQYHFIKALNQFKAPWEYEDYLMITLCENCHSRGHNKFKVPNVYV